MAPALAMSSRRPSHSPLRHLVAALLLIPVLLGGAGCGRDAAPPAADTADEPIEAVQSGESVEAIEQLEEPVVLGEGEVDAQFGVELAGDGSIAQPLESFAVGDPVCVAVTLPEGTTGGPLRATLVDLDGQPIASFEAVLGGQPPRASGCFAELGTLERTSHQVRFEVGGQPVGEASFLVSSGREPAHDRRSVGA